MKKMMKKMMKIQLRHGRVHAGSQEETRTREPNACERWQELELRTSRLKLAGQQLLAGQM